MLANVGLPMVCVTVPTIVLALPLIALVEAAVLRIFCCASFREAWRGAIWANLLSGLLGVPLAWLALVIAQIAGGATRAWGLDTPMDRLAAVTLQAPWLIPYEDDPWCCWCHSISSPLRQNTSCSVTGGVPDMGI